MERTLSKSTDLRFWKPVSHSCQCNIFPEHSFLLQCLPVSPLADPTLSQGAGGLLMSLWANVMGLRADGRREQIGPRRQKKKKRHKESFTLDSETSIFVDILRSLMLTSVTEVDIKVLFYVKLTTYTPGIFASINALNLTQQSHFIISIFIIFI